MLFVRSMPSAGVCRCFFPKRTAAERVHVSTKSFVTQSSSTDRRTRGICVQARQKAGPTSSADGFATGTGSLQQSQFVEASEREREANARARICTCEFAFAVAVMTSLFPFFSEIWE